MSDEGRQHLAAPRVRANEKGWYRPRTSVVTPESAGWGFSGLEIVTLAPGGTHAAVTERDELVVVPLAGSCAVESDAGEARLAGRANVFAGVTDSAYIPVGTGFRLTSAAGGRFALGRARADRELPFRYVPAGQVRVEQRGAGQCARQVNNFATPDVLDADRLIACEVITPAGNWSSYPPHKHDSEQAGESVLEEIYYFEVADGPAGPGMGYLKAAEVLAEVRSGDVVLIPYGYHGPAMAVPGYDLYYLNVMAGPGRREWLICEDPAHSWIRETW
jgi:5-deoxy-glucuronate isomerase